MPRIFLAVNFDEDFRKAVGAYTRELAPLFQKDRPSWVDPRLYHLTLYFFGEVDMKGLIAIRAGLRSIAEICVRPELGISGIGFLPSAHKARVLYLGFIARPEGILTPLVAAAGQLSAQVGGVRETRSWHAHLTLARFREPRPQTQAATIPILSPPLRCETPFTFDLMESFLSPRGPRYEIIDRYPFAERGRGH